MLSEIKSFMSLVYLPLVLFISFYAFCISIYSLKAKNDSYSKYIYNINFNIYIMGIIVSTFSLGFCLMLVIKSYKSNSFVNIVTVLISLIIIMILYVLLRDFIKFIKKEDNEIENKERCEKELILMLNDEYEREKK